MKNDVFVFGLNETKKTSQKKNAHFENWTEKKKHFKKLLLEISQTCIFKQPSKEKKGADWCKEKKKGEKKIMENQQ